MASPGALRPRWGQPVTGIISFFVFFFVAWFIWYIFSDPRGPVGTFPYPFVLYLAMMILVGLWQEAYHSDSSRNQRAGQGDPNNTSSHRSLQGP